MSKPIKDAPDRVGKWGMIEPKGSGRENNIRLCEVEERVDLGDKYFCAYFIGFIDNCYPISGFENCKWFEIDIPEFEPF